MQLAPETFFTVEELEERESSQGVVLGMLS
jgi:hypothetical protein